MKISEVTVQALADYARIDELTEQDIHEFNRMKDSAVAFIKAYTGLNDEDLDKHDDITQALYLLVMDMYDNRNYQMDSKSVTNPAVKTILNMHSVNLL